MMDQTNIALSKPNALPGGPTILVAASGSGGHIFPAVEIARALRTAAPELRIEFVGSGRPLEEKLIDGAGFHRHLLAVKGVKQGGLRALIGFLVGFPSALHQMSKLIRERQIVAVVGVGGYVSVVPAIAGFLARKSVWVHEAELRPGLANWALSFIATRISTGFETAKMPWWSKNVFTGHPVRPELASVQPVTAQVPRKILVMGGSQGARGLDYVVPACGELLHHHGVEVVHQCRPESANAVREAYQKSSVAAHVTAFIDDMAGAYGWADAVVSRSGAGSVMELTTVNRPCILVPYPHQQGTHQTDNAMTLVRAGKALLVEEGDDRGDFEQRFRSALEDLLNPARYQKMVRQAASQRNLNAAATIANELLALAGYRTERTG
jgi:UDP-N-acetylglucosamine--N-acetylmuramyl-(pentapeptide) pyrophosphoryl-undecaprenol N-acetylglucosamine transferase